ncbi:unnamed protein product [Arctogadus glacialis]
MVAMVVVLDYPLCSLHGSLQKPRWLKVGYGICETPADFENTQLNWSYPLSFNADSDSTHSKHMDAQSCTSEHRCARASQAS